LGSGLGAGDLGGGKDHLYVVRTKKYNGRRRQIPYSHCLKFKLS
jgi:hypothetical protein